MASTNKKRIIVDYKNVSEEILELIQQLYPRGYSNNVIQFKNAKNELISAIPVETADTYYLVKISNELNKMLDDYHIGDSDESGSADDDLLELDGIEGADEEEEEDEFSSRKRKGRDDEEEDDDEE